MGMNIYMMSSTTITDIMIIITKITNMRHTTSRPMMKPTLNPMTKYTIQDITTDTTMDITMDTIMDTTTDIIIECWSRPLGWKLKRKPKSDQTFSKPDIRQTQWIKTAASSALHSLLQLHKSIVNATEFVDTYQAYCSHQKSLPLSLRMALKLIYFCLK